MLGEQLAVSVDSVDNSFGELSVPKFEFSCRGIPTGGP
jgi:hypothetical protein